MTGEPWVFHVFVVVVADSEGRVESIRLVKYNCFYCTARRIVLAIFYDNLNIQLKSEVYIHLGWSH